MSDVEACVSDSMQVEVIRTYTAKQPDELSLQVADVVLVSQAVEDGTSILFFFNLHLFLSNMLSIDLPFFINILSPPPPPSPLS